MNIDRPTSDEAQGSGSPRRAGALQRSGRAVEVALKLYASAVFVVLWLLVAAAVFTDGALLEDSWAWLSGLDTLAAAVVWLAILPIGVFLWAWQAALEPLWMGVVLLGLVAWSAIGFSGLVGLARRPATGQPG